MTRAWSTSARSWAAVPVAAGIGWLILVLLEVPVRWWARRRGQTEIANWRSVSAPAWLFAGTVSHQIFVRYLGIALLPRHYYFQITSVALIVSVTWIVWRFVRWSLVIGLLIILLMLMAESRLFTQKIGAAGLIGDVLARLLPAL